MAKASKQQKINPSRVQTKTVKEIAVTFTEFNFEKWYPIYHSIIWISIVCQYADSRLCAG
jgi:hypothetical protein